MNIITIPCSSSINFKNINFEIYFKIFIYLLCKIYI